MATEEFQRARSPARKEQRREAILAAAVDVALAQGGIRAVSLADIAQAVGIHKSALLRYFATREEIFLELGRRAWRQWADGLVSALPAIAGGDAVGVAVAQQLAASFAQRPLLCDLIPHAALNLERHATLDAIRAYKLDSIGSVRRVAGALGAPLPALDTGARVELVSCTALLAGSMWQIATPPPPLAELYASDPELGHALVDFEPLLRMRVATVIAGLSVPAPRPAEL
jgi:AcrR family transcriptional regulator